MVFGTYQCPLFDFNTFCYELGTATVAGVSLVAFVSDFPEADVVHRFLGLLQNRLSRFAKSTQFVKKRQKHNQHERWVSS